MSEAGANRPRLPRAASIGDLARQPVTAGVVLLVSLAISGMAAVALVALVALWEARARLEATLERQHDLAARTLRAVEEAQHDVNSIRLRLR